MTTRSTVTPKWVPIAPRLLEDPAGREALLQCAHDLELLTDPSATLPLRQRWLRRVAEHDAAISAELRLCISVFCDLRAQGWLFLVQDERIAAFPPDADDLSVEERKAYIRMGHLLERDAQLAQPATRAFILRMEQRGAGRTGWHSIFSLMRDGRDLAARLRIAAALPSLTERTEALRASIKPYVQVVRRGETCPFTGLDLGDVWRYFRHTWTTFYHSTPGRQLSFLIRDAAAPHHPIIGIGALGSSIVQLKVRDAWIGWTPDEFIRHLRADPSVKWARWLSAAVAELFSGIYTEDFIDEGVLTEANLLCPDQEIIERLRDIGEAARSTHRLYPQSDLHKSVNGTAEVDWRARARSHLFRAKRAQALAELLSVRRQLTEAGFTRASAAHLERALADSRGVRAILSVLRRVKASHVGVEMMDLTVCGAIAPYNTLLGGKLVSLLMASSEVVSAYREMYSGTCSVIASAMAGRAVRRPANLVLLGTTSLYGVASSQYNRIRMPAAVAGGVADQQLEFIPLGRTSGFGSYHFSQGTIEAMELVLARTQRGREVNSIFGEGVNPKLRKVRAALNSVGLPSSELLRHGQSRLVYAVPLASNFRSVLLGYARRPHYILPPSRPTTEAIAKFWRERWLARRIENPGVLDEVARHSVSYPVEHGARVVLPELDQGPLFEI